MKKLVLLAVVALAGVLSAPAHADTITGSLYTGSTPFTLLNLGTSPTGSNTSLSSAPIVVGGDTITFTGGSSLVVGNVADSFASPFGAGNSTTNYLSAQPDGTVSIAFSSPQTSFDLLWGTVDNGESGVNNQLVFNAGGTVITGQDIVNALALEGINIIPGASNVVVEISGLSAFTSVTASDTGNASAFEFVPGVPTVATPEPATIAMLGIGLLALVGLTGLRRRTRSLVAC